MHGTQAEEDAAAVTVQVRSTLAHQIRRINQLVCANGALGCFLVRQFVSINTHSLSSDLFSSAEIVAEPLQAQAGSLGNTHHMPCAGHCAAEGMNTALGVDSQLVCMGKHHAAGADGGKGLPVFHNAGTDSRSSVISGTADHQGLLTQPGQLGSLRGNVSGHFAALVHLGQHVLVDIQDAQQLVAPAAVRHVQHLHAAGVGNLCGEITGQHKPHIVFGKQHMLALRVVFRLVIPHPDQFGEGESG